MMSFIEKGVFSAAAGEAAVLDLPIKVPVTAAPFMGAVPVPYLASTVKPSAIVPLATFPEANTKVFPDLLGVNETPMFIITAVAEAVPAGSPGLFDEVCGNMVINELTGKELTFFVFY